MGKLNQNFTTWKGNYKQVSFYIEDVTTVEGMVSEWACAATVDALTNAIEKSTVNGSITLSGKVVTVTLNPTDTASMDAGDYYHELRLVDINSHPSTPAIGVMTLKEVILDGS